MIKAVRSNQYTKIAKNGLPIDMYVYTVVEGTPEELADYAVTQGVNYREDNASRMPLYHSTRFYGDQITLVKGKSKVGSVLVDAYRPMTNENFELKRVILTNEVKTPVASVAVARPTIDMGDASL
jgi:hypothetical protein